MTIQDEIDRYFGNHRSADLGAKWAEAKRQHPLASTVTGTVVLQFPHGVYLDIGCGFPAAILVVRLANADVSPYTDLADYPAIGSEQSARVCAFDDRDHVLYLSQLAREEMLGE